MINKFIVLFLSLLISLCLPVSVMAQKTDFFRLKSGDSKAHEPEGRNIEKAGKEHEQQKERISGKQKRFEAMHRRYLDDAELPERRVYRKTEDSKERPADRYEEFEQKRERHRKYNEYIEQNSGETEVDRLQSGVVENYSR